MKRNCDEIEDLENDMITDETGKEVHGQTPKKLRENKNELDKPLQLMEFQDGPTTSRGDMEFFDALRGYGHQTLVEREPNPGGYSLLNPNYVGKKGHRELTELEASFLEASNFTEANARNKIEMIGQQMKHLQETLYKVIQDTKRDSELHSAACNFVKKPGHIYHLYERPSGQKYFSMLSLQDWNGKSPHKFLGSWFLESDQSWLRAEDMHLRHQGVNFLKEFYMGRRSIQ